MASKPNHPKNASQKQQLGFNYGNCKGGLGSSIKSTLEESFPSSPLYKDAVPGWTDYRNKVLRGSGDIVPDGQDFQFTTVDGYTPSRTYSENFPPTFEEVPVGSRGKPGSPWTPNTASPRGESTKPQALPMPPVKITAEDAADNYGTGAGGTKDPLRSSARQLRVNQYNIGKWS